MLLKTGQCFTEELALNCPTIVACVTALPTGPDAAPGDALLGPDGQFHALPAFPAQVPQELTLAGQTLTLSNGGGSVTLPDSDDQTLTLVGNDLSISGGNTVTLPSAPGQVAQVLSIAGNTVSLSGGGGSITVPDSDDQQLSIAGNVISLTDGGSVTLPAAAVPFATPAETVAGTSTTLAVNPADLVARENMPAQTGLSNNLAAIPAPAANQSPWGQNLLGETLHYEPGVGWKVVADKWGSTTSLAANFVPAQATITNFPGMSFTMPRAGKVLFTVSQLCVGLAGNASVYLMKNGVLFARFGGVAAPNPTVATFGAVDFSGAAADVNVAAGDVFSLSGQWLDSSPTNGGFNYNTSLSRFSVQYN